MRSPVRALVFLVIATVLAGLARERLQWLALPPAVRASLLPFRVSALLATPPDTAIAIPVARVRRRQIAETWHAPRGQKRQHEGQDIFAPSGTPVYSATNGIVVRVGEAGIGGNAVSVLGAGGVVYYYAHLSRFAEGLHAGEEVTPQSMIGYVGNTGNARTTPPHLHFGVYSRTGAVNPLPLLVDRTPERRG